MYQNYVNTLCLFITSFLKVLETISILQSENTQNGPNMMSYYEMTPALVHKVPKVPGAILVDVSLS